MNLAVKLYSSENPNRQEIIDGIPLNWPAEVVELGESIELPGEEWILMTKEEYDSYRNSNMEDYNTYWDSLPHE